MRSIVDDRRRKRQSSRGEDEGIGGHGGGVNERGTEERRQRGVGFYMK